MQRNYLTDRGRRQLPKGSPAHRAHCVPDSQYDYDQPHPHAALWKRVPVEELPLWEPAVGHTLLGEFSGLWGGDGRDWRGISVGETIKLRVGPQVNQPVTICTLDFAKSLREIKPILGTALCIQRIEDKPRWKKRRWETEEPLREQAFDVSVVEIEDVEAEEPAPEAPLLEEVF